MEDTDRTRYIDGLRVLAAILEANPAIPLPMAGRGTGYLTIMFHDSHGTARDDLAAAARAFPCSWTKRITEGKGSDLSFFDLLGTVGGLNVELTAVRDVVCERVVTGTTVVDEEEVITPAVTRTVPRTVPVVEWRCGPLLAPREIDRQEAVAAGWHERQQEGRSDLEG